MSTIRQARLFELPEIWRILAASLPGWEKPIRYALTHFPSGTLVSLNQEGTILAALVLRPEEDRPGSAWLEFVAAAPDAPKGTGKALMSYAESWLASQEYQSIRLAIRVENKKLAAFYSDHGYTQTAPRTFEKKITATRLNDPIQNSLRKLNTLETIPYRACLFAVKA